MFNLIIFIINIKKLIDNARVLTTTMYRKTIMYNINFMTKLMTYKQLEAQTQDPQKD